MFVGYSSCFCLFMWFCILSDYLVFLYIYGEGSCLSLLLWFCISCDYLAFLYIYDEGSCSYLFLWFIEFLVLVLVYIWLGFWFFGVLVCVPGYVNLWWVSLKTRFLLVVLFHVVSLVIGDCKVAIYRFSGFLGILCRGVLFKMISDYWGIFFFFFSFSMLNLVFILLYIWWFGNLIGVQWVKIWIDGNHLIYVMSLWWWFVLLNRDLVNNESG